MSKAKREKPVELDNASDKMAVMLFRAALKVVREGGGPIKITLHPTKRPHPASAHVKGRRP